MSVEQLTRKDATRIALAAQGLCRARRAGKKTSAHIGQVLARIGLLQIDSVNVLMRAHYLPLFSRLGPYDPGLLDAAAWQASRRTAFEYWGHEASLIPLALHPFFRWRMARAAQLQGIWSGVALLARERPDFIEDIRREVERRGPLSAGDIGQASKGGWWGWSETKIALEFLFWAGRVTTATRRGFERVYDVPERVIPGEILNLPTPLEADAHRHLIGVAARALGVATEADLRDYFRLDPASAKPRIAELVEAGALTPVEVEGWRQRAYLDPAWTAPRRPAASALVSPFDPLIWERDRTERLFDFRYRLEIYTPAHKRQHGYYVLPFLLGDTFAARVDLKAERKLRVLRVAAAHLQPGGDRDETASALIAELAVMSDWLSLDRIVVDDRGDLAEALRDGLPGR